MNSPTTEELDLGRVSTGAGGRLSHGTRQHAHKLREALASAFELHRGGRWGRGEIEAAGRRDYERVTGHAISARHFWRLFDQVIARQGGKGDFNDLALYLPGRLPPKGRPDEFDRLAKDLPSLASMVRSVADVNAPTRAETLLVWTHALEEYERLIDGGLSTHRATRRVVELLSASGLPIARSRAVLRRTFARKVDRWIDGGRVPSAIEDLRATNSGCRRPLPLSGDDMKRLTARALTGSLTKAWRDAMANAALSPAAVEAYIANPASKSYVPRRVRDLIGPDVEMLQDIHHGPRQARLKGAYITRDWSMVRPGDWLQGDDVTIPIYFFWFDAAGRLQVLRGQLILIIDCRTNRVLAFALHADNNYTATVILGALRSAFAIYGMPRRGLYLENGPWRSARLINGRPRDTADFDQAELGLREYMEVRHALPGNPRAKPVERVIGLLQDRLEDQPGYCGRNEQTEKFERLQKHLRQIRAGKINPSQVLLHRDQWATRFAAICEAYNDEPQEGKLKGQSPREAWDTLFDHSQPLVRLPADLEYLLNPHRSLTVTGNGVCVEIAKQPHWFRNEQTGLLIGRTVQVAFNPEDLSSVILRINSSDRTAIVVPAEVSLPAMDAPAEAHAAANASREAQNSGARTLYAAIQPYFPKNGPSMFRQIVADSQTVEMSQEIAAEQAAIREKQADQFRTQRKLANIGGRFGPGFTNSAIPAARRLQMIEFAREAAKDADTPTEP